MTEELQADRASDRRIAERLGHKIAKRPLPPDVGDGYHYYLDLYDGPYIGPMQEIPEYTTSLDAAIELINPDIVIEFRRIFSNLWQVFIPHELDPEENYVGLASGNPALAVCRAWWAWMDSREEA